MDGTGDRAELRIVSLVPSVTETLLAWGITPIACTRFCEQPTLHHVGGTKDPAVRAIIELAPDLVVVDAEENRVEDYELLVEAGLSMHSLHIRSVNDVNEQFDALAERLGVEWDPIRLPAPARARRRAIVPIWRRPWMALGRPTYADDVLHLLGVSNVFADRGPYHEFDPDEVRQAEVDLVIAPSEPYPFSERHRSELEVMAPIVFVDGRDLFWWGSRTTQAMERLAAVLD